MADREGGREGGQRHSGEDGAGGKGAIVSAERKPLGLRLQSVVWEEAREQGQGDFVGGAERVGH